MSQVESTLRKASFQMGNPPSLLKPNKVTHAHLLFHASLGYLVVITITSTFCSHTMRQKSLYVFSNGPRMKQGILKMMLEAYYYR